MKLATAFLAAATASNATKRFNKIRAHADTLLDLIDNNTTASDNNVERAEKWVNKVFAQAGEINVDLCNSDDYTVDTEDTEEDQALVFDQDNFCKLTGQVGTALRSYVRKFGCEEALPKKNFMNTFAKRTNRMRNIFMRLGNCDLYIFLECLGHLEIILMTDGNVNTVPYRVFADHERK